MRRSTTSWSSAGRRPRPPGWVDGLLDHVASSGAPVDFVSTHTYGNAPLDLRATLERHGREDAQIWWTEWGVTPDALRQRQRRRLLGGVPGPRDALGGRPDRRAVLLGRLRPVRGARPAAAAAARRVRAADRRRAAQAALVGAVPARAAGSRRGRGDRDRRRRGLAGRGVGVARRRRPRRRRALERHPRPEQGRRLRRRWTARVTCRSTVSPDGEWTVREYRVDADHSNIAAVWSSMADGADWPTDEQWATLRDADELAVDGAPARRVVRSTSTCRAPSIVLIELVRVGMSRRWWRSAVVYQVYVRSFADGDGDGVGDLAGLTAGSTPSPGSASTRSGSRRCTARRRPTTGTTWPTTATSTRCSGTSRRSTLPRPAAHERGLRVRARPGAQPRLRPAPVVPSAVAAPADPERARFHIRGAPAHRLAVDVRRTGVDAACPTATGTCTCSPPSSRTSNWTHPVVRSPTRRRRCGSGSRAVSTGSGSTSPAGSPRTRRTARCGRGVPHPHWDRAEVPRDLPVVAQGARRRCAGRLRGRRGLGTSPSAPRRSPGPTSWARRSRSTSCARPWSAAGAAPDRRRPARARTGRSARCPRGSSAATTSPASRRGSDPTARWPCTCSCSPCPARSTSTPATSWVCPTSTCLRRSGRTRSRCGPQARCPTATAHASRCRGPQGQASASRRATPWLPIPSTWPQSRPRPAGVRPRSTWSVAAPRARRTPDALDVART